MSKYVLKNDHPLIPREQRFSIDRKLLTVHSEDRDITKWPSSNHFEIQLPQTYTNVETLALVEYNFPVYYYTFSNQNQNTIITVYVYNTGGYGATQPPLKISIEPGFYTPQQLATEMENKLNLGMQNLGDPSLANYNNFRVYYDEVRQRLLFGNIADPFTFIYNKPESYYDAPCYACPPAVQGAQVITDSKWCQTSKWFQYTNWGLGYNLGFVKCNNGPNTSDASAVSVDQKVYYVNSSSSSQGTTWLPVGPSNPGYVLIPPNPPSLNGDSAMYMEIDKYNYQDEMQPYSENTSGGRCNDYNGIVNASFAKIPLLTKPTQIVSQLEYQFGNNPPDTAEGISSFFPPLDKLSKLKFKFRYHNGTLVDFGGQNFSFTIALYCYRDEIARSKGLRIPFITPGSSSTSS
jgi:hypothetical protein